MNIHTSNEQGYIAITVSGLHDSLTAIEICRVVISLLEKDATRLLIDTTAIMGYVPIRNKAVDLDCFPLELRDGSTRVLFVETASQMGNNLFGEIEYNRNGIPLMITINKEEGLKWLRMLP